MERQIDLQDTFKNIIAKANSTCITLSPKDITILSYAKYNNRNIDTYFVEYTINLCRMDSEYCEIVINEYKNTFKRLHKRPKINN